MNDLVPIGRFSRMTRLSVKALRHYQDIGLLMPAEVDDSSGYRYYRISQAPIAEAIRLLRSVDMPLDEIAEVLRASDPELAVKYLEQHRERLRDRLADHTRMLAYLERLIQEEGHLMPYEIVVKDVPSIPVVATRIHTSLAEVANDVQRGFAAVASAGHPPVGPPLMVFHDVIDEQTSGTVEICFPVAEPVDLEGDVYGAELPEATVASTMHVGPYMEVSPAYHALTEWIQAHGHESAAPPREIYLNDPNTVDESEYLTEVQWPIA